MKPIELTPEQLVFLNGLGELNGDSWDLDYGQMPIIKKHIKQHYIEEQGYLCAYCRCEVKQKHGMVWDVEHIVPKSKYPRFTFEPLNLAVACKDCNGAKVAQEILSRPTQYPVRYSRASRSYKLIHPHFDAYSDCLLIQIQAGKRVYVPKNKKGQQTISICGLDRFSYEYGEWSEMSDLYDILGDEVASLGVPGIDAVIARLIVQKIIKHQENVDF